MTTNLIYIPLDMRSLNRWAGRRGLIRMRRRPYAYDEGYTLHVLTASMFGNSALRPFRLFSSERRPQATLYAYSAFDADELCRTAEAVATPDCLDVLELDSVRSKAMPAKFGKGQSLNFDIRVRPVRRLQSSVRDERHNVQLRKGAEIDAFRMQVIRHSRSDAPHGESDSPSVKWTREDVYRDWLALRFGASATLLSCRLTAFRRHRAVRGAGRSIEGPDAVFQGSLSVGDPAGFANILTSGIGRHKAYGYGMLLLRPPA